VQEGPKRPKTQVQKRHLGHPPRREQEKEEERTHPLPKPKPQRVGHPAFGQSASRMSKSVQMWVCRNG